MSTKLRTINREANMKRLLLFATMTINFSLITISLFSQSCLPEGITFTTQAQIDSFQICYPGCTEIEGNVEIYGDDITNLNGLYVLTSIGGTLDITWNPSLLSLNGLDSLTSIGGNLKINHNIFLESLAGLNSLISVGGSIELNYNSSLESLSEFIHLISIGGDLQISNNETLINLAGMNILTSVGGALDINNNQTLSEISGLNFLTSIGGFLSIWDNLSLSDISGFGSLTNIGEYLEINNNDSLENLSGFSVLNIIGGSLRIVENNALTSLSGLENIYAESIFGLIIYSNSSLSSCEVESVCEYLTTFSGWNDIHDNAPGCNYPEEVMEACDGVCLPFGITFSWQEEIDNFQVNHPGCAEILGDVVINGGDITNLDSLNILTYIYGDLGIGGNPSLTNLSGLENLTSIGGSLLIIENDNLNSLESLANLTYIDGGLNISKNDVLFSLSGLDNIDAAFISDLYIYNNALLSTCDIESVCSYLAAPNGAIYIIDNAPGCIDQEEVEDACFTEIEELTLF
ncbi:MAG: hypothetical protein R2750_03920 [Bacteroidales bacterium]